MNKRKLALLIWFGMITAAASAQITPNIGLQLPAQGTSNWNIPINYNSNRLDSLLSGGTPLPAVSVVGTASMPNLNTWVGAVTYSLGQIVFVQGIAYSSLANGNLNHQPPNNTYWSTTIGGGGGGSVTSVTGTANQIDVANSTTTPALSLDPNIIQLGTYTQTNPGMFSNTASYFPNTTVVNGCNLNTIFQIPQYTAYLTAAISACATAPTNSPGTAYNQTAGGFFAATASGIGSGSGESTAVGVSSYAIITGNNTLAFGNNPLVEDYNDSATGQIMNGQEVDVQPQKASSAYAYGGFGVLGTAYDLYNQGGQGGTYGPALFVNGSNYGSPAYWGELIDSSVGSLGPASVAFNINSIGTAISGTNYNCPVLLNAYESYWNSSAAVAEGWTMNCIESSGTNPNADYFQIGHNAGTVPAGQTHYFELLGNHGPTVLQLDGSTSGLALLAASTTGGALNITAAGGVSLPAINQPSASSWAGTCTMATATTCAVTLGHTFTTPICTATVQGTAPNASACSVSGTTATITAASSNSATWAVMVFGNPN